MATPATPAMERNNATNFSDICGLVPPFGDYGEGNL